MTTSPPPEVAAVLAEVARDWWVIGDDAYRADRLAADHTPPSEAS